MRVLLLLTLTLCCGAALVDRVSISVGTKVITQSEIELRIRLTALENHIPPDFSAPARKIAAGLLIDQKIVEREMDLGHYPRIDSDAAKQFVASYATDEYQGNIDAMAAALGKAGLTLTDLQTYLAYRNDVVTFLSIRFRPAVSATEQNALVVEELANRDLEKWIANQRRRIRIEYLEKDLAP